MADSQWKPTVIRSKRKVAGRKLWDRIIVLIFSPKAMVTTIIAITFKGGEWAPGQLIQHQVLQM